MYNSYVMLFEEFKAAEERFKLTGRMNKIKIRNTNNKKKLQQQKDPLKQELIKSKIEMDNLDMEKLKIQTNIIGTKEKIQKEVENKKKQAQLKAKAQIQK
jgi:hypothetical protein